MPTPNSLNQDQKDGYSRGTCAGLGRSSWPFTGWERYETHCIDLGFTTTLMDAYTEWAYVNTKQS